MKSTALESKTIYRDVDVIVAGGGPSGVAAAINSARAGARTVIVERYGRLGGAAVTSTVNPLMGGASSAFLDEVMARFRAAGSHWEVLDLVYADMLEDAGVEILLHCWVFDTLLEGDAVRGIRVLSKEGILELRAKVVVDATADADVSQSAGAAYEMGREGDKLLQPMTIMYRLGGVNKESGLLCGSEEEAHHVHVPGGTWHDVVTAGQSRAELPENVGIIRIYESSHPGERVVNATQVNHVDGTKVADLTRAELEGRRQAITVTEFIKQHAPGYESCFIAQMPASIGVRETRRVLGVEYLTREDLISGRKWPDAVVRNANFVIDIHNPNGSGQAETFAARVQPYDIPYGCLVPRDVDGLLVAGRCISGSHEAHASYRVQQIAIAIGAASGTAAALAAMKGIEPRHVDVSQIQSHLGITPDVAATPAT